MPHLLRKVLNLILTDDPVAPLRKMTKRERPNAITKRELISRESHIGRTVFGPVPTHVARREFFNLDEATWMWHEEVKNADGTTRELTMRYEVQPRGVLKVQPGPRYTYLEGNELHNFTLAVQEYYARVMRQVYARDPQTGRPL